MLPAVKLRSTRRRTQRRRYNCGADTGERLERVLKDHSVDLQALTEDDVERLNRVWHRLQAWPDSVSGLTAIRRTYLLGPLSNTGPAPRAGGNQ
jgi:2-haloacid dehalogenase